VPRDSIVKILTVPCQTRSRLYKEIAHIRYQDPDPPFLGKDLEVLSH
jgi:hypothetical protein